ncbi:hypothetical protein CYY_000941 [Polysphondylium violaceum]|uniref:SecA family profile domain-containing protein n=1 Tax=Polysphondylium violaceum TaxID=133409 RepID=A0A8J4Q405_9MYCE|nr:hypothetical protein CYY_000941 [Polysphondylium violaceum]
MDIIGYKAHRVAPRQEASWRQTQSAVMREEARNIALGGSGFTKGLFTERERQKLAEWHRTGKFKCDITGKTYESGYKVKVALNRARANEDKINFHHINCEKKNPHINKDPRNIRLLTRNDHYQSKQGHRGESTKLPTDGRFIDREKTNDLLEKQFQQNLKSSGLEKSYNGSNPDSQAQHFSSGTKGGALAGEIGGVAVTSADIFKGWEKNINQFNQPIHTICIEKDKFDLKPEDWNSDDFSQIMIELSNAIYQHGTIPFFSLHFNQDGSMYTVLHPAYHNTLVGKVILILDYYMKGFINGGFLPEEFALRWSDGSRSLDRSTLKLHMIDIKEEISNGRWKNIAGLEDYKSLRERAFEMGLEGTEGVENIEKKIQQEFSESNAVNSPAIDALRVAYENLKQHSGLKYQTSFRILASERSAQCVSGVWMLDGDFEVKYTIEPTQPYQQYMDAYQTVFGTLPLEYLVQEELYKEAAEAIRDQMPLLPPCKRYFQLLKQISFLSSYLTALKSSGQVPLIAKIDTNVLPNEIDKTPNLLPPLPVRYYEAVKLSLTVDEIISEMQKDSALISKFYRYLDSHLAPDNGFDANMEDLMVREIQPKVISLLNKKLLSLGASGNINKSGKPIVLSFIQLFGTFVGVRTSQLYSSLLKNIMKPMIEVLERYNEIAANYQAPWPSSQEIENDEDESVTKIFQDKLNQYAISTKDLQASAIEILNSCKNHIISEMCSGCHGNITSHRANVKVNGSPCRNQFVNYLTEQFTTLHEELKEKYEKEGFFTKLFSSSKSEMNKFKLILDGMVNNNMLLINELIKIALPGWEEAVKGKLSAMTPLVDATNEFFEEQLVNFGKSTTTVLRERLGTLDILSIFDERQSHILSLLSKKTKNVSVHNNTVGSIINRLKSLGSALSSMMSMLNGGKSEGGVLPISKLILVPDKDYQSKGHQLVWGGCGMVLNQLEIQSTFPSKSLDQSLDFAEHVKSFLNQKLYQWVHLADGPTNYSAFSFKVIPMDQQDGSEIEQDEDEDEKDEEDNLTSNLQECANMVASTNMDEKSFIAMLNGNKAILSQRDQFGNSILHFLSAKIGVSHLIKSLVSRMGSEFLNEKNSYDMTPISISILMNQFSNVKVLLESGANINIEYHNSMFPLLSAVLEGHSDVAILLSKYCKVEEINRQLHEGDTSLHVALMTGQIEVANQLCRKGASVEIVRKRDGFTAIEVAAQLSIIDFIKSVPFEKDRALPSQGTALHVAVENNSFKIVEFLLQKGWSVTIQQLNGETPLILALDKGFPEIANLILTFSGDSSNVNPLPPPTKEEAARPGYRASQCIPTSISKYRTYINSKKQTAAMIAVSKGYIDIAWNLISRNKESWVHKDQYDNNLLDYIILYGESRLLEKVIQSKMFSLKLDESLPNNRLSYLAWSLMQKKIELADILLENGAKYFHPDPQWTIGASAVRANHSGLLGKLMEPSSTNIFNRVEPFNIESLVYEKNLLEIAAECGSLECLEIIYNKIKSKQGMESKNFLLHQGTELLYYALVGRSKKVIEYLIRWYHDLNIQLNIQGDYVVGILLSTDQMSLLPLFQNRGLKLNNDIVGVCIVDSAIKLDKLESIQRYIKEANLELLNQKKDPLGSLFYYNLGLRAIEGEAKGILSHYQDEISSAFSNVCPTSSEFTVLTINVAEPLFAKLVLNFVDDEKDLEVIRKLIALPNISEEMLFKAVHHTLKIDNAKLGAVLLAKMKSKLSQKFKFYNDKPPISILELFQKLKAFNCWKLIPIPDWYRDSYGTEEYRPDPEIIKSLNENILIGDDISILNTLKQLTQLNKITLHDEKKVPLLHAIFLLGSEELFKYCIAQGCDPFALFMKFNILLNLGSDASKLGQLLSILEKNFTTEQLEVLFYQEFEDRGIVATHIDLLLSIFTPSKLREAYQSAKMGSNPNYSKYVIRFANTLGVVIDEKKLTSEMGDEVEKVFKLVTPTNRKLAKNQKFIAPDYFVKPTNKILQSMIQNVSQPSFIFEWFPNEIDLKITDKTDIIQLERQYHHLQMIKVIDCRDKDGCTPLMKACLMGENQAVTRLLQYGADPSLLDNEGNSALSYALQKTNKNPSVTINILIPYSTSTLSIANNKGILPISIMTHMSLSNQVSQLLMKGGFIDQDGKYNHYCVNQSIYNSGFEASKTIKLLLENQRLYSPGGNQEQSGPASYRAQELASHSNNLNNLNSLIEESGSFVDTFDLHLGDHGSPLDIAIQNNYSILINSLTRCPDDSNLRWVKVIQSDNLNNLELLNSHFELYGIIPLAKLNALHIAAYFNCHNLTRYLYVMGVSINEVCEIESTTPLQLAAFCNNPMFIKSLINSIRSNSTNNEVVDGILKPSGLSGGRSALQIALCNDHFVSAYLLMQASSDVLEGKPSIQLLNYFSANPHSIPFSNIAKMLKYLIIFGDNSLIDSLDTKYISPDIGSFISKMVLNVTHWNNRLSFESKLKRAEQLGFTTRQSYDILNSEWLVAFSKTDTQINTAPDEPLQQIKMTAIENDRYKPLFEVVKLILNDKSIFNLVEFVYSKSSSEITVGQLQKSLQCFKSIYDSPNRTSIVPLFDKAIARFWPWEILLKTTIFNLITDIIESNSIQLWNWFISHFTLISTRSIAEANVASAIKRFREFMQIIQHQCKNNISTLKSLSNPPTDLQLSFQSESGVSNMELAILSLGRQEHLRFIQASVLHNLPKNREYIQYSIERAKKDSLLVCRQVFEISNIDLYQQQTNSLQVASACGGAIIETFRGLLSLGLSSLNPIHATFINNFITNIRILQMTDNTTVPVGCKLLLVQYFMSILSNNKFNVISKSDYLDSSRIEWCREMQKIISLVPQLLKSIGITYFKRFVAINLPQQTGLKLFEKQVGSLREFIELSDNILSSWAEKIPRSKIWNLNNYQSLKSVFKEEQDKIIKLKMNQRPFSEVLQSFQSPINKNPLEQQELAIIQKLFTIVEQLQDKHKDLSQQQLISICINSANQLRSKPLSNVNVEIISALRWLIYHQFGIFPYSTQVCCVLGLLLYKENKDLRGRIAQVLTGEGKSTIVTLLSAYCGLAGKQIDVITTSEYLAYRDFIKYEPFYQLLGISCSQITGNHPEESAFDAQILFGTNSNYEFALLRDKLYGSKNLFTNGNPREKDIVIVDEVDSLFIDSAFNSARMSIPSQEHHGFIYQPLSEYVKNNIVSHIVIDEKLSEEEQELEISKDITPQHIADARFILEKEVRFSPMKKRPRRKHLNGLNLWEMKGLERSSPVQSSRSTSKKE